jgi:Putative Actinobacterial Holin-X, holin superfamily III
MPPKGGWVAGAGLNPKNSSAKQKSLGEVVSDIVELLKAYAKQETLDPLKRLGRYLGFGVGGSVLIATGFVFLMLAGLRVLQVETGSTFTGSWSWAPYAIVIVVSLAVAALFLSFMKTPKGGRK